MFYCISVQSVQSLAFIHKTIFRVTQPKMGNMNTGKNLVPNPMQDLILLKSLELSHHPNISLGIVSQHGDFYDL
jgi:hypothetical protein